MHWFHCQSVTLKIIASSDDVCAMFVKPSLPDDVDLIDQAWRGQEAKWVNYLEWISQTRAFHLCRTTVFPANMTNLYRNGIMEAVFQLDLYTLHEDLTP